MNMSHKENPLGEGQPNIQVHQAPGFSGPPCSGARRSQPREELPTQLSPTTESGNQLERNSQNGPSVCTQTNSSKRNKWTSENYKEILYCHFHSMRNPSTTTLIKSTYELWKDRNQQIAADRSYIDANKLANIRRDIIKNKRLTDHDIEKIHQNVNNPIAENNNPSAGPQITDSTLNVDHERDTNKPSTADTPALRTVPTTVCSLSPQADELHNKILVQWEKCKHSNICERQTLPKVNEFKLKKVIDLAN